MEDLQRIGWEWAARALTVLWTELQCDPVQSIGYVVRVIVPEMMPLSQAHSVRWLATPRLLEYAGLRKDQARPAMFNPFPHPFA